jgi:hypothetical protein
MHDGRCKEYGRQVPKAAFDRQHIVDRLGLSIPSSARACLDERLGKLRETFDLTEGSRRSGGGEDGYDDFHYIRRRYITKEQLRAAIPPVCNAIP